MLQFRVNGQDAIKFFETLVVGDIRGLRTGQALLSLFTNEKGGIIDDTVISRYDNHLYIVSNAGCAQKDLNHIVDHLKEFQRLGGNATIEVITDRALLALQGPKAAQVLSSIVSEDLKALSFMHGEHMNATLLNGQVVPCLVTRCGYTGEDGFEISVPAIHSVNFAETLLQNDQVKLAGLAVRDSLRLEAGLCLYGNDIDETTTPAEAGLIWCIGKRRKQEGGFLGAKQILAQLKGGDDFPPKRKRVGLLVEPGAPARHGYPIVDDEGKEIGVVTSGGPSPLTKKNIAMAYVPYALSNIGTQVNVLVRKAIRKATVVKTPFVESKYYRSENK